MATRKKCSFSLDADILAKVKKVAKEERRNISNQIDEIFTEWLKARKEK